MDLGLEGKRAIVTGGSLGIGRAIARELAREGVDVAIVARSKDQLEATANELSAETGRRIIPLAADVTSREQVDAMVAQAAAQLGGLHILVNSGSAPGGSATATGPIESVVDDDLLQDFNVKYVGALRCARWPRGRRSWASPPRRSSAAITRTTRRAATPSGAWWTRPRWRTSPSSSPPTRRGPSAASSSWRPAAPAARSIISFAD